MHAKLASFVVVVALTLACWTDRAAAQTPADGFGTSFQAACATATPGSELAGRCAQINGGGPGSGARRIATAAGNRLNLVPAQGRIAALGGRTRARGLRARRDDRRDENALASPATGSAGLSLLSGDSEAAVGAYSDFDTWTLQASVGFGKLDRDASPGEAGFENDRLNALIGVARRVSDRALLGVALTYDREETEFDAAAGAQEQRATSLIAHAAWWPRDSWAVYASAGYGRVDLDTRREIDFVLVFPGIPGNSDVRVMSTALGAAEGDRTAASISVERALFTGERNLRLDAGLDHERTDFDSFTETGGGGFAVRLPARSIRSTQSKLGLSGDFVLSTASGVVTPYARAYWRHEFDNDGRLVAIQLRDDAGRNPILFQTPEPDRNFLEAGAGVAWVFAGGRSLYFDVEGLFGHDFLSGYTLSVGGSFEF